MKRFLFLILFLISLSCFSQVPDSLNHIVIDTLTEEASSPDTKKAQVIISSSSGSIIRGNSWEDRWLTHVETKALGIGKQLLLQDSTKRVYKAIIQFSINEDGSLKDLQVWSSPANALVEKECRKVALSAPKKKPLYRNGKFIRTTIRQPVDIKVN